MSDVRDVTNDVAHAVSLKGLGRAWRDRGASMGVESVMCGVGSRPTGKATAVGDVFEALGLESSGREGRRQGHTGARATRRRG
jgi:hypothetical protein